MKKIYNHPSTDVLQTISTYAILSTSSEPTLPEFEGGSAEPGEGL